MVCDLGMGQVAEGRQVFPNMSVLENLEVGGMLPRARASAARTLEAVFAMFPRLKERERQAAGTLSGGEQQMLAIGRCLMGSPRLVMFDEPSMGLAPTVVHEVLAVIRQLHGRGMTVLLIEHDMSVVMKVSERVTVLDQGKKIAEGTPDEIKNDQRVVEAYLGKTGTEGYRSDK